MRSGAGQLGGYDLESYAEAAEEQQELAQHGAAPKDGIFSALARASPGAGEIAYQVFRRQCWNWVILDDDDKDDEQRRKTNLIHLIDRADHGFVWQCTTTTKHLDRLTVNPR
ncbi:MAG: hypothetical protein CMP47_09505 [Rickettsiales bacterium]|nr:hypothetical protein [Rickettsiales bacterium]